MKIFEKSIPVVEFTGCTMKVGDGFGDANYHAYVGKHTIEECLAKVKAKYPKANGMTVSNPCENECACYAEFNMSKWSTRTSWQACIFKSGNHTFYTLAKRPPMVTFACPLGSSWVELVCKGFKSRYRSSILGLSNHICTYHLHNQSNKLTLIIFIKIPFHRW